MLALGVRLPFGKLPGDIAITGERGGFYFPIVTMLIISVVLTVIINLFFRRFVIEMGGLIRGKWFFWLGGNFAPTAVDDKQNPLSTANV